MKWPWQSHYTWLGTETILGPHKLEMAEHFSEDLCAPALVLLLYECSHLRSLGFHVSVCSVRGRSSLEKTAREEQGMFTDCGAGGPARRVTWEVLAGGPFPVPTSPISTLGSNTKTPITLMPSCSSVRGPRDKFPLRLSSSGLRRVI